MAALRTSALIASAQRCHMYIGFHCMEGVPPQKLHLQRARSKSFNLFSLYESWASSLPELERKQGYSLEGQESQ